jgi:hypothetical protein
MTRQNGVGQRNAGFGRAGLGVFQAANSSLFSSQVGQSGVRSQDFPSQAAFSCCLVCMAAQGVDRKMVFLQPRARLR